MKIRNWLPFTATLLAYLLILLQWFLAYKSVWYANLPEETAYFRDQNRTPGYYIKYLYIFAALALVCLTLTAIVWVQIKTSRWLITTVCVLLAFTLYMAWTFSINMRGFYNPIVMAMNLSLFIAALFMYLCRFRELTND